MSLRALVFCSDEKILRVLRRVLSDLEIGVEHSHDGDSAIHQLTRKRYEAVIVDCTDQQVASQVLRSARSAPSNKRAVAVAIIDPQQAVRGAFDQGAHFVLYKPISMERAKTSFRAARALMKRERRRNQRIPVSMPVVLATSDGERQKTTTTDLGEGGMAVQSYRPPRTSESLRVFFTLPGTEHSLECISEVAWENSGRSAGVRFIDLAPESRHHLKAWLNRHSPEMEQEDPPLQCKLSDLSPGGCYLETNTPFPVRARVVLCIRGADGPAQVEGLVRVMHVDRGMGIEFRQTTEEHTEAVIDFIQAFEQQQEDSKTILVEPEGLESGELETAEQWAARGVYDPLLELFYRATDLSVDAFQSALRKQRSSKKASAFTV